MRFLALPMIALLFSACGNSKSMNSFPKSTITLGAEAQGSVQNPQNRFNTKDGFRYRFTDEHQACTTGAQAFDTFHGFCMGILDDQLNQNCAAQERYNLFFETCSPKGYLASDGLRCKIGIIKDEVTKTLQAANADFCYNEFTRQDFSKSANVCIGRLNSRLDGSTSPILETVPFGPDFEVTVDASYVFPTQITTQNFTHFNVQLASQGTQFGGSFKTGIETKVGCQVGTVNSKRVFIACKPTHGCDRNN